MGYAIKLQRQYVKSRKRGIFGYKIEKNNATPGSRVTPIAGCKNENFRSVTMNFTTGQLDYGDWEDAFFMPKVCMLKYDGTVDYYINPNNYMMRLDSDVASDAANPNYNGNCMIEFPQIWVSRWQDELYEYCYISDRKRDETYKAYNFIDMNGNLQKYCYMAAYNGSYPNADNKLRSLSSQACMFSQTAATEIARAQGNGTRWYTGTHCDRELINDLLLLIGMNTNCQQIYGNGHTNGSGQISTGTMDGKGLFFGSTATSGTGVKVFGIENYWGNIWDRIAGKVRNASGYTCVKMTWGTEDGSTTTGYNTTGNGYIVTSFNPSGSEAYIKDTNYSALGRIETLCSGASATTYMCDGYYSGTNTYAFVGGCWLNGAICGPFACYLGYAASVTYTNIGARVSYR